MRRVARLTGSEEPIFQRFRGGRLEKGLEQCRSVDDGYARSRSARTASAGSTEGAVAMRLPKRTRISSIVGPSVI
jgi:hypothetical protein